MAFPKTENNFKVKLLPFNIQFLEAIHEKIGLIWSVMQCIVKSLNDFQYNTDSEYQEMIAIYPVVCRVMNLSMNQSDP